MPVFHLNRLCRLIPVTGILIIAATCFSCGKSEQDSVPSEKPRGWHKEPAGEWHDNKCWYARQEIISEGGGEVLVRLLRTDGVQVFLNGREVYTGT